RGREGEGEQLPLSPPGDGTTVRGEEEKRGKGGGVSDGRLWRCCAAVFVAFFRRGDREEGYTAIGDFSGLGEVTRLFAFCFVGGQNGEGRESGG
ncbi:hypothetical protein HAX54_010658, partial [Datura stramonium]|nr:hypothetical protein [Datura stramonium]